MSKFEPSGITSIIPERSLRAFVQTVLPTIYDDSLSYYELLSKVVKHLNSIADNINILSENQRVFIEQFTTYANNVLATKDEVQNAIAENKQYTDTKAQEIYSYTDGHLNTLSQYVDSETHELSEHFEQKLSVVQSAISENKQYTDTKVQEIYSYTDGHLNTLSQYVDSETHELSEYFEQKLNEIKEKLSYAFTYNVNTSELSENAENIVAAIGNDKVTYCIVKENGKDDIYCYYCNSSFDSNNDETLHFAGEIIEEGVAVGKKVVSIKASNENVTITNTVYKDSVIADFSVTVSGNNITLNSASITPLDLLEAKLNNKNVVGRLIDTLAPVMPYRHVYYANSFFCAPTSVSDTIQPNSMSFNFIIKIDGNSIAQYLVKSVNRSTWSIEKTELNTDLSRNLLPDVTNDDNGKTLIVKNGIWSLE